MALKVEYDRSLLENNTFGIDVKADCYMEYHSESELVRAITDLQSHECPAILNIGAGSNLLFCGDFHGAVLRSAITSVQLQPESEGHDIFVRVGSGHCWDKFVEFALSSGWYGAENLSGIPGDVGASAVQNIGAYGAEVKDLIVRVEAINSETCEKRIFSARECCYSYRDSIFKRPEFKKYVITYVTYHLSTDFEPNFSYKALADRFAGKIGHHQGMNPAFTPADVRREVMAMRDSKLPDPAVQGNAGSFFMNPIVPQSQYELMAAQHPDMPHFDAGDGLVKLSAAWLIDNAGWKGKCIGPVGVYHNQPLVLVNLGGATGEDVMTLAETLIADIATRYGVTLHMEVNKI